MRIVAALVLMLGLVGCGADDDEGAAKRPPVAAYRVLVRDYNAFVEAFYSRKDRREPTKPREVRTCVGYDFHRGVRLVAYQRGMTRLCLTGPRGDIDISGGESTERREKVFKGQDLVDAIPAFSAYGDITPQDG